MMSRKGLNPSGNHGNRHPGRSARLERAHRRSLSIAVAIENIRQQLGEVAIVSSAVSIADFGQSIYRVKTLEIREERRGFLEELTAIVPICPMRSASAEIIAQIAGEYAALSINLPLGDLMLGACGLELRYAVAKGYA